MKSFTKYVLLLMIFVSSGVVFGQTNSPLTQEQKIVLDNANIMTEPAVVPFEKSTQDPATRFSTAVVEIGTGTGYGSSPSYRGDWANYYQNVHTQTLYLASELGGPMLITDLQYSFERFATTPKNKVLNAEIRLFETTDNALTAGAFYDVSGATLVWSSASYVPATATGWANVIDITDYTYTGTKNLIVDILWGDNGESNSTYYRTHRTKGGVNRMLVGYHDSQTPPNYRGVSKWYSNIRFYFDPLNPGDIDGHVFNGNGLTIAGAKVGIDGYGQTTTDATGHYLLTGMPNGAQDVICYKDGYNITTDAVTVPPNGSVTHNFTLTKPSLTINPTFFNETLNPNEYLTKILGVLNTGDGPGDWSANIVNTGAAVSCDMQVALLDSYGDGWNGGKLTVKVNGVPVLTDITLASGAGPEYFSFPVNGGDNISTVYTAGGWPQENSYKFYDGDGDLIHTHNHSSLPEGTVFGTCTLNWLTLSEYSGTVPASGGSQNIGVNFNADGLVSGDVFTANIIMNTDPNVGTFTIPVTMTIFGDSLSSVTDLEVDLINDVTGLVKLTWAFNSTPTFQHFKVTRDGLVIETTTNLNYSNILPGYGTYCYTVIPVFAEGNGVPGGPECVDWLIPALCWSPATMYNEQWPDSQEEVIITLKNCGDGTLDFSFPDFGSGFIKGIDPVTGQIASGDTLEVTLTYDATGFSAGLHDEWLKIETNDTLPDNDSIFNQMKVYVPAQLFGTVTDCNSGQPMESVTVTSTGNLGGVFTTETNGSGYYKMYVDKDTCDVKFSLLGFETVIVADTFAATGVMTEVSTTMCETPYPVKWVLADPNEADTECLVTWTLPMGPYEIIYDDGEANEYVVWSTAGGGVGVHFTPAGYPAKVLGGRLNVGDGSFPAGANFIGTKMAIGVMDDDGTNGLPGTVLDSNVVDVNNYGWVDFYDYFNVTINDGDFYIVMWQLEGPTKSAPVGVDTDLPTVYRSAVKMPGGAGWATSPYQDLMIRAYVSGPNEGVVSSSVASGKMVRLPKISEGPFLATGMPKGISGTVKDGEFRPVEVADATRDMTNYKIARVSNFNPDLPLGPTNGTLTLISSPTAESYNDLAFGGQPAGLYAYAVKTIYESSESIWVYSNIAAHLLDNEVTIKVTLCDGNDPDGAKVKLAGQNFPYHVWEAVTDTSGVVVFDSVINGMYDLSVFKVGYNLYKHDNLAINDDMTYSLVLTEIAYPVRNLYVDSLTSHATWDEPLITELFTETFEAATFPPDGWQSTTLGVGWFRSDDVGTTNWPVPAGDGFYAVSSDNAAGCTNDGSMDYLITPKLDLRESANFAIYFSQFYDGKNDQLAYIEYSYDAGATWEVLETMSPVSDWTEVSVDLSAFSGSNTPPIWIAFHSNGGAEDDDWGSGWAVDNVTVKNGPSPILGYYVYLDDAFTAQTPIDVRAYTFIDLVYGQTYTAAVRALYACGLSDPLEYTWRSTYLHPPRNLGDDYIYGTNEVPLKWNPPMTGVAPMASAASMFDNLVFDTEPVVGTSDHSIGAAPANHNNDGGNSTPFYFNTIRNGDNVAWISGPSDDNLYTMDMATYTTTSVGASATDPSSGDFMNNDFETMYVSANWGADLYSVAVATGAATSIAPFSGVTGFGVNGMACDRTTNTMYVAMTTSNLSESQIGTVDLATGVITAIGSPNTTAPGLIDIAVDGTGQMYGWCLATDNSYLINKETGDVTLLGALGFNANYGQGGNYNADDGLIYLTAFNGASNAAELRLLDKTTGSTAYLSALPAAQMTVFGVPHTYGGPQPGVVPAGLVSFNLYRDGVNIANIPYDNQGTEDWVTYVDNNLDPATYLYDVSAVYDLTTFGFPGEEGESAWNGTDTVEVVWGFGLPFFEGWVNGTFAFQGWRFNDQSENWVINSQTGDPAPSAEFTWDPLLEDDYTSTLTSNPITADLLTEGDIFLDFDLKLDDRNSTGKEKMLVEVYNGSSWAQVAEFANDGSFDFKPSHINITTYSMSRVFQVRFNAVGQNSFDVVSWFVDNISIYRECAAPTALTGVEIWDGSLQKDVAKVCWEAPFVPGPIEAWVHWDDGTNTSGIGMTSGGTFSAAARWDAGSLSEYAGTSITKVQYVPLDGFTSIVLKIWTGANAGTMIYEEDVTSTAVAGAWNEVTLTAPIPLNVSEELWVGYTVTHPAGSPPAGVDAGPAIAGYGDMITTDGTTWNTLSGFNLNYNWNIQFFVTEASSSAPAPMIDDVVYNTPAGTLALGAMNEVPVIANNSGSRYITGFNIYRMLDGGAYEQYDVVAHVDGQTSYCYHDTDVTQVGDMYCYQVTATFKSDTDACESAPAMASEIPLNNFICVVITGINDPNASLTNVYPNPAQDMVTVTSSAPMKQLTVTNYVGQVVYTSQMNEATSVELNTSSYQAGVYLVKIDSDNGVVTKRVIISR